MNSRSMSSGRGNSGSAKGERLRIAWFSPLNCGAHKQSSVSAYVSDLLLPLLRERFEIELFHDSFESYRDFTTHHFLKACERHKQAPFDLFFYQLEDCASSYFVRIHIGLQPGVVWFHDLVFSTDGPEPILNSPWEETVKKYSSPEHPWPERGEEFFKDSPFGAREAANAAVALFSNPVSHLDFKSQVTHTINEAKRSYFLPFPVVPKVRYAMLARNGTRIGFCGTPRIEHRGHKLLSALRDVEEPFELLWLVSNEERALAEELLKEFEIETCTLVGGRSPHAWSELVPMLDVAVHTLFSVYGQPGPYLAASLTAGLPALVSDFGSSEHLPNDLVFKIQPGASESFQITNVLNGLLGRDTTRAWQQVKDYAYELYDSEGIAQQLGDVWEHSVPHVKQISSRWNSLESEAARSLIAEVESLLPDSSESDTDTPLSRLSWEHLVEPVFKELGWLETKGAHG